jgi:hypothetical protein
MRGLRAACGAADPFRANHQPYDSQGGWPYRTTEAASQAYLNKVARRFNERPRETLQIENQQGDLTACVASTG